ncbi:GNAT family N-acetyltransferase [Solirubrobacter ginsenosidimutans]|uniref:GNAT family N-acetyltransferase n=1 Tax=Solirubrobacter ginsenosidimutans TaxID=490573 RepID=A0A9X3S9H3_9ACTN|nr:GNAT family N-acetyltransferase [Solirubrobacter ginsenosidimutans]MDA0165013.1 GNAT family N-acetyltransferase [Solirubrobacter ginsenosidimutans]
MTAVGEPAGAVDVALRDGSTVRVRPVVAGDYDQLRALLGSLSPESRWLRFFSAGVDLDTMARRAASRGSGRGYGVVATVGAPERIVGHAAYVVTAPGKAEVAFEVSEERHGQGIGTLLLAHLAAVAPSEGIQRFVATVHPSNSRMAQVFRNSGFPVELAVGPGLLEFELPASLDAGAIAAFEDRDRAAAVAAVGHMLRPSSVALIGASRREGTVGTALLSNLLAAGFTGPLRVVNPKAGKIAGIQAYPAIADVPGPIDLAVIAVPAQAVPSIARECADAGVRALVVLSSGFAEVGADGARLQAELLDACRTGGMRLVGPNCLGVLNTAPDVSLNATFAPVVPRRGRIALASQSGAFGITAIAEAARRGLGLSSFVSTGDKADLSGNDFLRYWEQDADTDVILLYLESFGNPRRFGRIARTVARTKPIVAVKSGRSAAGARAAASHTGGLLAASDVTVDALFAHAGVIRTETVAEQLDTAALLAAQPLPRGNRVAIVTNAGGPGIAAADACTAAGLAVEPLSERCRRRLPDHAALGNPIDMIASASAEDFQRTIEQVAEDPDVDAVIAIFIPPLITRAADVAAAIRAASERAAASGTPLLAVFMAVSDAERAELSADGAIPVYGTPEEAVRALGHVGRYADWHREGPDEPPVFADVDGDLVAGILADALGAGGAGWLDPADVERVLAAYGIALIESRTAHSAAEAGRQAADLGGLVAIKAVAPGLVHKADAGAVALELHGKSAVVRAAQAMTRDVAAAGHAVEGFIVQRMAPPGVELIVGIVGDPDFGPVVACGAGGHAVELLGDVAVRLAPLGPRDAKAMLRSLRTYPLLDGYRGAEPADVAAVEDVLLRVSALAAAHPEIAELDCNPLRVGPAGALVLDARIRVAAPPPLRPFPALDR